MNGIEQVLVALVSKARENYIPPGPFLGGRVWSHKADALVKEALAAIDAAGNATPEGQR